MKDPKIKTKVVHSESKKAFNVVANALCQKFKIARLPYLVTGNKITDAREKEEAFNHAEFVSYCFNNSEKIFKNLKNE